MKVSDPSGTLSLGNGVIEVTVLPQKGSDIYALVDVETGIDVLFKTPWGYRPSRALQANSAEAWLAAYPGGWQLILPNGGAPSIEHGIEWGFHGEACLVAWDVLESGPTHAVLETSLFRSPLTVHRTLELDGPVLRVHEEVMNTSPQPIEVMWGHHPAFGAPLLAAGSRLYVPAQQFTADIEEPGTLLAPGSRHGWPVVETVEGDHLDLSRIPGPDEPRAILGYLEEFTHPFFAIVNPALRLGAGLRWDSPAFDRAWFWQEVHHADGFPFFSRAYVTAVEPYTTTPGQQGIGRARRESAPLLVIPGGGRRAATLEAVVFHSDRPVVNIEPGGRVVVERGT